jgi:mannosyltransferase
MAMVARRFVDMLPTMSVLSRDADAQGPSRGHVAVLLGLLLAAILGLWWRPIRSTLWLDEAVTWWIIQDGWAETLRRGSEFSGGNPFYYLLVRAVVDVLGPSELSLRILSVAAMATALVYLMRLAARWFDLRTALYAGLVFACNATIQFEARNARTYALALAFFLTSTFHLARLLEERRRRDILLYGLLASGFFHTHFIFAAAYFVHIAIVVAHRFREGSLPWRRLSAAAGVFLLALLPSLPLFLSVYSRRQSLVVAPRPYAEELVKHLVPQVTSFTAIGMLLVGAALGVGVARGFPALPRSRACLFLFWIFFPPTLIFTISRLTPTSLFIPRYFSYAIPAIALTVGMVLRRIGGDRFRVLAASVFVCVALATYSVRRHHIHDWKGVAVEVRKAVLEAGRPVDVLLHSGLIEAKDRAWWTDPGKSAYLNAPFSLYPLPEGCTVHPLPWNIDDEGAAGYMQGLLEAMLARERPFLVVTRDSDPGLLGFAKGMLLPRRWHVDPVAERLGNLVVLRCWPPGS